MAPKRFSSSKWNEYTIDDIDIELLQFQVIIDENKEHNIITKKGLRLYYNSALFAEFAPAPLMAPVILDQNDFEFVKTYFNNNRITDIEKQKEIVGSISSYLKTFPQRPTIYLRTLSSSKKVDDRRVFANEVLEILDFLLRKRYNKLPKEIEKKVNIFKQRYEAGDVHHEMHVTIGLAALEEELAGMDIDKKLITLVPDIMNVANMLYRVHVDSRCPVISVLGPQPDTHTAFPEWLFADCSQALMYIFDTVVTEVDWSDEIQCTEHENCTLEVFRNLIINCFKTFKFSPRLGIYHSITKLKMFERSFKQKCQYKLRGNRPHTPLLQLRFCDFNDKVKLSYVLEKCKRKVNLANIDELYVPAWKARVIFLLQWVEIFFDKKEYDEMKNVILEMISFKVPLIHWKESVDLLELVLSSNPELKALEKMIAKRNSGEIDFNSAARWNKLLGPNGQENIAKLGIIVPSLKWKIRMNFWPSKLNAEGQKRMNDMITNLKNTEKVAFLKTRKNDMEMVENTNKILREALIKNEIAEHECQNPTIEIELEPMTLIKVLKDRLSEKDAEYDALEIVFEQNLNLIRELQKLNKLLEQENAAQKQELLNKMALLRHKNSQSFAGVQNGIEMKNNQDKVALARQVVELEETVKKLRERCEKQEEVMKSVLDDLLKATADILPAQRPIGGIALGTSWK